MTPEDMDELLFSAFDLALGEETRERLRQQYENYDYYDGKQHKDDYGNLVKASELERPAGLDYDPTRYATNYFKAIVDRKARWQMGGKHGIHVPRKQIDDPIEATSPDYQPSEAQRKENERAESYERLLYDLWEENKMRTHLIQAARDRLIADRVVCKIVFNQATGKLRWIWRPDTEFVPIFSDDDFEEMIACHFIRNKKVEYKGEEVDAVQIQTFRMIDGVCHLKEAIYLVEDLKLYKTITPEAPMNLDFIPVVQFPVNELLASKLGDGEISHLREQNDVLNQMNEDAIDSLKFEMFPMTAVLNAPEGTAEKMKIAPGAVLEARGASEGQTPDIKKVESGFRWKEAFKDQYMRVKAAMHEVSGLPQIVPQELNFGGLNGEALRILFHDIISDTEEHWLAWGYGLAELHEKSIRYLQARLDSPNFAYDKEVVRSINDYKSEIHFVLPLPDNRKELVELLGAEMANSLESQSGAMERLGVDNVQAKKQEIENERLQTAVATDPYRGEVQAQTQYGNSSRNSDSTSSDQDEEASPTTRIGNNGELERLCDVCGGTGIIISTTSGKEITCPNCRGDGWVQVRKR